MDNITEKKQAHTPEPWKIGNTYLNYSSVISDNSEGLPSSSMATQTDVKKAYGGNIICQSATEGNAERIVACVNAMKGISNPNEFILDMKKSLKEISSLVLENETLKSNFLKENTELRNEIAHKDITLSAMESVFNEYKYNAEQAMRLAIESSDKETLIKNQAINFLEKLALHLALITEGDYLIQGIQSFVELHKSK